MRQNNPLAKTPINGIAIGEVFKNDHGQIMIRVKKPGCNLYEVITLEQLLLIIVAAVAHAA